MVFSLLAYFFSMVTAFAVVMTLLVGFGDSQLRSSRMRSPVVAEVNINRDAFAESEKAKEAQRAEEARKAAEAEARENAKKLARAKLLRERKQAMLARLQQQREQGENSLAFGYAAPFSDGAGLYSFAPRYR
jgi:single-stranded DNA-specific DHH superfamily exonuclease